MADYIKLLNERIAELEEKFEVSEKARVRYREALRRIAVGVCDQPSDYRRWAIARDALEEEE